MFTRDEERELPLIISTPRFATYLAASGQDIQLALTLYQWNLEVSSAFMVPLQVCEIAVRNGIVHAVEQLYGPDWHISPGFAQSLPRSKLGYCPHQNFMDTKDKLQRIGSLTAGKIVADLKFAFWENMITKRHDMRLWKAYFFDAFPYADKTIPIYMSRRKAHSSLENIRKLRNRIAHHEPIFVRDISAEYDQIRELVYWRSPVAAEWLTKLQQVTILGENKPGI